EVASHQGNKGISSGNLRSEETPSFLSKDGGAERNQEVQKRACGDVLGWTVWGRKSNAIHVKGVTIMPKDISLLTFLQIFIAIPTI
ncbi:unnamed protein product, partial [Coffea canephora]